MPQYTLVSDLYKPKQIGEPVTIADLQAWNAAKGYGETYRESCATELDSYKIVNVIRNDSFAIVAVESEYASGRFLQL